MSNPFRFSSGKTIPKESRDTPPQAIFSDYPAAHSAITSLPSAQGDKIPSPTPGMPAIDNPYANLPPTIDLPETPAKHSGGPASEDLKARIASCEHLGDDILERPETPLLPPTPVLIRPERLEASSQGISRLLRQPVPEQSPPVGKESYELEILTQDTHHDQGHLDGDHDTDTHTRRSVSTSGLENPSLSSTYPVAERRPSVRSGIGTHVHQSSTLDSIIGRYNDDSELLRVCEGSQRSVQISNSQEVSSLSANDDGEVCSQDSTAGHTPPLASLMFGLVAPERSASRQPPRDPLPDVLARQDFRHIQDVAGSEPTNYGNTRELLNMGSQLEEENLQSADPAEHSTRQGLVFNPHAGISATDRLPLVRQGCIPIYRDVSDEECEMLLRSASGGSPHVGSKHEVGISNASHGPSERLLRPLMYMPKCDDHSLVSVSPRRFLHLKSHEEGKEEEEEPVRLRRLIPAPDVRRYRHFLDHGGPKCSQSQAMAVAPSFGRGRMASGRFQHDETLASLTGELPEGCHQDMQNLIKDIGSTCGAAEENDRAVFDTDPVTVKDEEEVNDGDWETVHESGLKPRVSGKLKSNREQTATSLANMSSYESLTGSVPPNPWGPLTGRAGVPNPPPKLALSYRSRVRTDTETGVSVMLPEYEPSGEPYASEEVEMTRRMRPQALERLFPAFPTTSERLSTSQRLRATYRHPEPMSAEHNHPFSLTSPAMAPTDDSRAKFSINPGTTTDQVQHLAPGGNIEDGGKDTTKSGLVISEKRNTSQFSASAAAEGLEIHTLDAIELSRPSNLSVDGSYTESFHSGPALSTSGIVHDSQYLPKPIETFSKSTNLGPKGNITGSIDGTGMRAVGSSEAGNSTDSAMMKFHKYERLDDERTLNQTQPPKTNARTAQTAPKTSKNFTFAENPQTPLAASTSVLTKNGLSISRPKKFKIPTTLPKRNSFAISTLNTAKRLDEGQTLRNTPFLFNYNHKSRKVTLENIRGLIEMTADDWNRLQSKCMTFPLRDDHLNDMLELDGMSTGQKRCHRDNIQPDGRYLESAKCDNCNRWERSHGAVLIRQPFKTARAPTQQEIGRRIVFWSTILPFIGWGFLFVIANRMEASSDLIAGLTQGVIREFGDEEIEAADFYFKCIVGALFLLFLILLIFTIIIVVQS